MTADLILQLGAASVFGAVVMAVVLMKFARPKDTAEAAARTALIETPTAEHDIVQAAFDDYRDALLPLYLPDCRGMPLGEDEAQVIEALELELRAEDPAFLSLFESPDQT